MGLQRALVNHWATEQQREMGLLLCPSSVLSGPQVFRPVATSEAGYRYHPGFQLEETEAWGGVTTCPGYSARGLGPGPLHDIVLKWSQDILDLFDISLPKEIFLSQEGLRDKRKINKAVTQLEKWRCFEGCPNYSCKGWLCCETPRDWHFLCFFHLPFTVFCCLYYILEFNIYILVLLP